MKILRTILLGYLGFLIIVACSDINICFADSRNENDYGYYLSWCVDDKKLLEYILKYHNSDDRFGDTFGLTPKSEYELHWIGQTTFCKLYYSKNIDEMCGNKDRNYWNSEYDSRPLAHRQSLAYKVGLLLGDFITRPYITDEKYQAVANFFKSFTDKLEKSNMLTASHYLTLGLIKGLRESVHIESDEPMLAFGDKYDSDTLADKGDYNHAVKKEILAVTNWMEGYKYIKDKSLERQGSFPGQVFEAECEPLDFKYKSDVVKLKEKLDEMAAALTAIKEEIAACTAKANSLSDADIQNSIDTEIRRAAEELARKANNFGNDALDQAKCIEKSFLKQLITNDYTDDYYAETILLKKQFLLQVIDFWHGIRSTAAAGYPLAHEAKKINRILDGKILTFVAAPESDKKMGE